MATERECLEALCRHFIVKDGPNKDTNQYGDLDLWWAAKDVREKPDALYNPWMHLGNACNSFSLGAMGHLADVLAASREALGWPAAEEVHPGAIVVEMSGRGETANAEGLNPVQDAGSNPAAPTIGIAK